jgi:hypothetical protein
MEHTHILKTKASRRKGRRWTFIAVVTQIPKDAEGKNLEGQEAPEPVVYKQRGRKSKAVFNGPIFRLNSVTMGNSESARADAVSIEESMSNEIHKVSPGNKVKVMPVPHETVSEDTINQLQGMKDFSDILGLAFDKAVRELVDTSFVSGAGEDYELTLRKEKERIYTASVNELRPRKEPPANAGIPKEVIAAQISEEEAKGMLEIEAIGGEI